MFWTETTDEHNSFVLFSKCSFEPYQKQLTELGGTYSAKIKSTELNRIMEGWCFPIEAQGQIDEFIAEALANIEETSSDEITVENLYDLLVESFDRIGELEKKNAQGSSTKDLNEALRRIEELEKKYTSALARIEKLERSRKG